MQDTYKEFIHNILNTRGRFACGDEYHERHHIVPKCMGGGNEEDNLIDLFAREHYEAHRLLASENPDNRGLVYAWSCMAFVSRNDTQRYQLTAEEYEEVRKAFSKAATGKEMTEETRAKLSIRHTGLHKGEKNNFYGVHMTGDSNPFYGHKHTEEAKKKMRDNHADFSGEKNPFYGKHHTEESKIKIKENRPSTAKFNNPACKPVYCIELGEIFWGARDVQNKYGIHESAVRISITSKYCAGHHPETGEPLHWLYVYDKTRKDGSFVKGAITLGYITQQQVDEYFDELYKKGD